MGRHRPRTLSSATPRQSFRSLGVSLMGDLPVGVHPSGADAWYDRDLLAPGVSVGAPPDTFNPAGQDWELPAYLPHALRESGFEPVRRMIRASLRWYGGLRVDHVMGWFRLYWIPDGAGPEDGGADPRRAVRLTRAAVPIPAARR